VLLPLVAAALALATPPTPKTTGAYVPARFAGCFTSGACSSREMAVGFVRFTRTAMVVDWSMESKTVPWRVAQGRLEIQECGAWRPLEWRELGDGAVETTAMLMGEPDTLRWVPLTIDELSKRWEERWTTAQLARLAGTWGSGPGAVTVGPRGLRVGGTWRAVVASPCLERCEGPAFHVCLEPRRPVAPGGDASGWWVVREEGLQQVTPGALCSGGAVAYVDAFEPRGAPPLRPSPHVPPTAGVPASAVEETVSQRLRIKPCHTGRTPLPAELSLTVAPSGLPTAVTVTGVPGDVAECVAELLWSLAVRPAPLGAPPTAVRMKVELPP
jgi:hypothetical protein